MKLPRILVTILFVVLAIGLKAYRHDAEKKEKQVEHQRSQQALSDSVQSMKEASRRTGARTVTAGAKDDSILEQEEDAGGHMLSRHVGKTEVELKDRLAHSRITASSSFYDMATAESATEQALKNNERKIQDYLNSNRQNNLVLYYRSSTPIGISIARGEDRAKPVCNAKFVLTRDSSSPKGYRIITGYPAP